MDQRRKNHTEISERVSQSNKPYSDLSKQPPIQRQNSLTTEWQKQTDSFIDSIIQGTLGIGEQAIQKGQALTRKIEESKILDKGKELGSGIMQRTQSTLDQINVRYSRTFMSSDRRIQL